MYNGKVVVKNSNNRTPSESETYSQLHFFYVHGTQHVYFCWNVFLSFLIGLVPKQQGLKKLLHVIRSCILMSNSKLLILTLWEVKEVQQNVICRWWHKPKNSTVCNKLYKIKATTFLNTLQRLKKYKNKIYLWL